MKKFLIIDGSSIFYRAFHAMPSLTAPNGTPTGAVVGFANTILKALREQNPDFVAVALDTAKKTFRNDLFPEYKATRPPMPDELAAQLPLFKEFLEVLGIKTCAAVGYEADDIIGTLATQACKNYNVEILTGDRDAFQLINSTTVVLLNKTRGIEIYDENRFWAEYGIEPPLLIDYKGLCGDPSDNIPGVKGVGNKTATSLLRIFGSLENILDCADNVKPPAIRAAVKKYSADAVLSKQLAKIICDVPNIIFDEEKFKVTPNLASADEFCNRYALEQAHNKIHVLFGDEKDIPINPKPKKSRTPQKSMIPQQTLFEPLPELDAMPFDSAKIFVADSLALAHFNMKLFAIKIFGGEIFSASKDDLQKLFDEFKGKIVLNGVKDYLHAFTIANLKKIFDMDIASYLLYPELEKATRNEELNLGEDLAATVKTFEKLSVIYENKMADANLTELYRAIELPLTKVLALMEERGVFVNKSRLKTKAAKMTERIEAVKARIYELADASFNLNSSQQVAMILFNVLKLPPVKKTRSGLSTDAEVMEELRGSHPIIEEIIQYRTLMKLRTTYLEGLDKLLDKSGRIHTTFNQTITTTGRLSSSEPNLQSIPVRTEEGRDIRSLFVPGAGYDCIVSADYSQIELRLLAHMSGDKNLIDAFNNGQDIHARTAAEVFGVKLDEVTPDLRRKAKAVNFGIVYGISAYGLAKDLHISREEAGLYIVRYFERYPGVKDFLDATVAQAHLNGYVMTMFGRRRALLNINSINFNKRTLAERMAMNTPIQGSAADIMKLAMIRAEDNLRGFDSRIILQVHDELVVEAKEYELAEVERILREAMEGVVQLKVPLIVDVHNGANWALAK